MPKKTEGPSAAALSRFMDGFAKKFEDVTVRDTSKQELQFASTGSLALDYAMGGGFVHGRVAELWGVESSGKSTLLTVSAAEYQKANPKRLVAWLDVENTFDLDWARAHGLDLSPNRFLLVNPPNAEDTADLVKELIHAKADGEPMFGPVILDSVGAMLPQKEKEKDADEATMALVAKTITRMVKIAAEGLYTTGGMLWIINQVRANLSYGGDLTRTGGFALGHVTTHRLKFRKAGAPIKIGSGETEVQVGQKIAIKVEKNKIAPPGRTAELTFYNQMTEKYGPIGLDTAFDVYKTAKTAGVFGRRGSWYALPDGTEHNGEAAVLAYLRAHPEAVEPIREKTLATKAHEIVTDPLEEG